MKVKVIKSFHDIHSGELHRCGSFLEVTEDRYHEILKRGNYVEPVTEKKTKRKDEVTDG